MGGPRRSDPAVVGGRLFLLGLLLLTALVLCVDRRERV